ncbi:MAG: hypothetical protein OEV00_00970 [Acidobacteriota bacterium]|nr:hypothetical protein [Acidobacteriota bacterium]MDH3783876.1 hypothetical protein [Acidobacteriota bacterium]
MLRVLATVGVLLVLSVFTIGCDSTQPIGAGPVTYEVQMSAVNVIGFLGGQGIRSYRVWEMYEDNDNNGQPDDIDMDGVPDLFNFCRDLLASDTSHVNPTSVPWSYTVEISVIPAGTTGEVIVSSPAGLTDDPLINLSRYDNSSRPLVLGTSQPTVMIDDGGMMRTFRFRDPLKLSQAHTRVARSTSNPLSDFDPMTYGLGNGLCSAIDPGPTVVDGQENFLVDLSPGDTIIVRARRGAGAPMGIETNGREANLSGTLSQDGLTVSVIGSASSDAVTGAGFSFSFTAR